ncbi:MAG: hypothetical protein K6F27_11620 [Ruminococcus sp.]|nr:hypothetical protein [Ruminococcus sp.]
MKRELDFDRAENTGIIPSGQATLIDGEKMKELYQRDTRIKDNKEKIKENLNDTARRIFSIAEDLNVIRNDKLYLAGGFKSFQEYCDSENGCGIKYAQSLRYIQIYNKEKDLDIVQKHPELSMRQLLTLSAMEESLQEEFLEENPDIIDATTKDFDEAARKMVKEAEEKARKAEEAARIAKEHEIKIQETYDKYIKEAKEKMDKDINDIREGMEMDFKMIEEEKKELECRLKELEAQPKDVPSIDEKLLQKKIAEATAKIEKENAKLKNMLQREQEGKDNDAVVDDSQRVFESVHRRIVDDDIKMAMDFASANDLNIDTIAHDFIELIESYL